MESSSKSQLNFKVNDDGFSFWDSYGKEELK